MPNSSTVIESVGVSLGRNRVTNSDLANLMETSDDWIYSRTGIRERRIADPDENNYTLGVEAAVDAIERIDKPRRIRAIFFATNTNETIIPTGVSGIHAELIRRYPSLIWEETLITDVIGGCQGVNSALFLGDMAVKSGYFGKDHVLVIGADTLSRVADFRTEGRDVAVLASDSGSAFVLGPTDEKNVGYAGHRSKTLSGDRDLIRFGIEGKVDFFEATRAWKDSRKPNLTKGLRMFMNGRRLYGKVIDFFTEALEGFENDSELNPAGMPLGNIGYLSPHQANARMFAGIGGRIAGIYEKFVVTIKYLANSSAGSQGFPLRYSLFNIPEGMAILQGGFGADLGMRLNLYVPDSRHNERRHRFAISSDEQYLFEKPDFAKAS